MHQSTNQPKLAVLYTEAQIAARVAELGREITRDYQGESLLLLGVLKGATIFLADLARAIDLECTFDFIATSSYGKGRQQSGEVRLTKDVDHSVEDQNVIVVEDILDTGLTLSYLKRLLSAHQPRSLRLVAFLDKPSRRQLKIEADYVGFTIPDTFVVGYGMDFAEKYRNLREICTLPSDPAQSGPG
jgi:hypoxanthine phosphoribosyltransferase